MPTLLYIATCLLPTAVIAYLCGCFNGAVIISKYILRDDVRNHGSGNAGATNMARVFGLGAGFATLAGDMLKAALAMWLGSTLLGDPGIAAGGGACILGHCFPVFHDFRGGKGISVGAMIGLAIDWRVFVGIVVVFLIVAFLTKKVSAGSLAASVAITILAIVFRVSTPKLVLAIFAMCVAIFQHRSNIKRLTEGTEADFKAAEPEKKK